MKLSKENKAKQRAIRKAIASGKSVSGLLAGVLVLATAGCDALLPSRTAGLQPRNSKETPAIGEPSTRTVGEPGEQCPPKGRPSQKPKE